MTALTLLLAATAVLPLDSWRFRRDGGAWQVVSVPHDGAIAYGFDVPTYGGSAGGLPYYGHGEYETAIAVDTLAKSWRIEIDGAMARAKVFVNGRLAAERPNGYMPFVVPLDGLVRVGTNDVRVTVDPPKDSARWYPGFGFYRDVRLVSAEKDHLVPNSVSVICRDVTTASATVVIGYETSVGGAREKVLTVENPILWSPETPHLYETEVAGEKVRYGIRTLRFDKTEGFFLNGRHRQMKGVCLHHDLGLFGAAFVREAARRQLEKLKEMGCDAIRTSHNPPAPALLDLCDEMGLLVMAEAYDEWKEPKISDGLWKHFDAWHVRDTTDFVRFCRAHPCVVIWSVGNELAEDDRVPDPEVGAAIARELTAIVHANDPEGRPVCAGHWVTSTSTNAIGRATDVYGANYQPDAYPRYRGVQGIVGTETCSTLSSRGVYAFPIDDKYAVSNQVSSYDRCVMWPNDYPPDVEFAAQEANPHVYGEFVWTGFDYLGESDPWRKTARSSYFGIFDLAGFPKDRSYLYKAQWRPDVPTAHIVPNSWNFASTNAPLHLPVHVYTSGDEAELFVNGRSLGRKRRGADGNRYRFVWDDVAWEPGVVSVKTWKGGRPWATDEVRTSGPCVRFEATDEIRGDYVFRTYRAVDANGVFVPDAAVEVPWKAPDGYAFYGWCNGDAFEMRSMRSEKVRTFSGLALVVIVRGKVAAEGQGRRRNVSAAEFLSPSPENRPWTYWWWLNGHVDCETIAADLADIKALGFGGVLQFDSRGYWEDDDHLAMEKPRNVFLDADWRTNLVFAAKEAKRLGLAFTMNLSSSAGWLEGPWKIGTGENPYVVDVTDRSQVEEYFRRFTGLLQGAFGAELKDYVSHFYACSFEGRIEKLPETATDADFAARNRRYLDNFYGPMVANAHRLGIGWYSESGGPWQRDRTHFGLANQLDFLAVNDMPMGEFWVSDQPGRLDAPTFMYGGAVMAGRLTGARRIAAEAFTHMTGHWSVYPDLFKRCADRAFADGVNHLVWHTYTASPERYGVPGYEYFAGSHINRGVTWHDDFAPVVEYLARCQYLLQQGESVVDYTIDAGPYPYLCKADLRETPWDGGGDVHPPRGLTYRLATSETRDTQAEVDAKTRGLVRDYDGRFRFAHRRTASGEDIYFLVGEGRERAVFRVKDKGAALWNPLDGSVTPVAVHPTRDGRTAVDLELPANGSVFVVFSEEVRSKSEEVRNDRLLTSLTSSFVLSGPWQVVFRNKGLKIHEPTPQMMESLKDLTENDDSDVRHFAGTATYRTAFDLECAGGAAELSLGLLHAGVARVFINGKDCGVAWCEPWKVKVPADVLRAGRNELSVAFTGTWKNRLIGDAALPPEERTSRSNLRLRKGPRTVLDTVSGWGTKPTVYSGYCSEDALQPSGLIGPVSLTLEFPILREPPAILE